MTIHYLNCFTCNARIPRHWQSGMLCLLVESSDGLVLVDTGLGTRDYVDAPGILRTFKQPPHRSSRNSRMRSRP